jgi:hypothetical protein
MGYLSWGVPIMAYALVSGSTYAMVSAIGSMDSAGKSAAAVGAQTASTGNLGLGNDSLNNYNANKVNTIRDVSTGVGLRTKQWGMTTSKAGIPQGSGKYTDYNDGMTQEKYNDLKGTADFKNDGILLGTNSNGTLTSYKDSQLEAKAGAAVTAKKGIQATDSAARTVDKSNKLGSSLQGSLETDYQNSQKSAWTSAIKQEFGDKSTVGSQLQHYIDAGATLGFQGAVFGAKTTAGFRAIRDISKSQELGLVNNYGHNLENSSGYGKTLSTTSSASQAKDLSNSIKDTNSLVNSYSYDKSNSLAVGENALLGYMANFSKGLTGNFQERANAIKEKGLELRNDPNLLQTLSGSYGLSQPNPNEVSKIKGKSALRQKKIAGGYTALDPNSYNFVKGKIKLATTPKTPIPSNIISSKGESRFAAPSTIKKLSKESKLPKFAIREGLNYNAGVPLNSQNNNISNAIRKNNAISNAREIVNVGSKPSNPITQKTLRAPMSVAWKPNMQIKHPNSNNFNAGGGINGPTTKTYQPPQAPNGVGDVEK